MQLPVRPEGTEVKRRAAADVNIGASRVRRLVWIVNLHGGFELTH
jgi:hypothetical protein